MNPFRLIVAGGRDFQNYSLLKEELITANNNLWNNGYQLVVISGLARGADNLGLQWAKEYNVPYETFPANWDLYGKSAGYKRNQQMADIADGLIAFWDGKSRGTSNMIQIMRGMAKPTKVIAY